MNGTGFKNVIYMNDWKIVQIFNSNLHNLKAGGMILLELAITIVNERNRKKSIEIMISLTEVLESIYGLMAERDPN